MEDDDVDLGHVEHSQSYGRAQIHGDGQRGGLDVELWKEKNVEEFSFILAYNSKGILQRGITNEKQLHKDLQKEL